MHSRREPEHLPQPELAHRRRPLHMHLRKTTRRRIIILHSMPTQQGLAYRRRHLQGQQHPRQ